MLLSPLSCRVSMLFLLLFVLFCAGCSAPPGDPADGKRWFMMHNCSSCHGPHGNDGRAVNIAGLEMGFGRFLRKLRRNDTTIMPSFPETKVSEQDAADMYAYLKTMTPKVEQ